MDVFPTLGYHLWFKLKPLFPHYKENKICGKKTFVMWFKFYLETFTFLMCLAWKEVGLQDTHEARHIRSEGWMLPRCSEYCSYSQQAILLNQRQEFRGDTGYLHFFLFCSYQFNSERWQVSYR